MIVLDEKQEKALAELKPSGSILVGATGSGKSIVGLEWYRRKRSTLPLLVITTAKKKDSNEWIEEAAKLDIHNIEVVSWNTIQKYVSINNHVVIFDEHRAIGYGEWAKSFIAIAKNNDWIILTATPGDDWMDFAAVFIAEGFYRNRTAFLNAHVEWNPWVRYPKVLKWHNVWQLIEYRNLITTTLDYQRSALLHTFNIVTEYDKEAYTRALKTRWNPFNDEPIRNAAELCYCLRRISNETTSKLDILGEIFDAKKKLILFYNFKYELEMIRTWCSKNEILLREWNGEKHQDLPNGKSWIYAVQFIAGSEAWNCTSTDTLVFFSQNYSYRLMAQAAGRIDRRNTPYEHLYYYRLFTNSTIDNAINEALERKGKFNERLFYEKQPQ